jgi:hypothetical protein
MDFCDSVFAIIRIQSNRGIGVMRIQAGIEYLCAFVQEKSAAETGFRDQGGVVESLLLWTNYCCARSQSQLHTHSQTQWAAARAECREKHHRANSFKQRYRRVPMCL